MNKNNILFLGVFFTLFSHCQADQDKTYDFLGRSFLSIAKNPINLESLKKQLFSEQDFLEADSAVEKEFQERLKLDALVGKFKTEAAKQELKKELQDKAYTNLVAKHVDRQSLIFDLFAKQPRLRSDSTPRAKIKDYSFKDLDFFSTVGNLHSILFNKDTICTLSGKARAAYEMANPCIDVAAIKNKQSIVKFLIDNPETFSQVDAILNQIKLHEKDFLGLWNELQRDDYKKCFGTEQEKKIECEKFATYDWKITPKDFKYALINQSINFVLNGLFLYATDQYKDPHIVFNLLIFRVFGPFFMGIEKVFEKYDFAQTLKAVKCSEYSVKLATLLVALHKFKNSRVGEEKKKAFALVILEFCCTALDIYFGKNNFITLPTGQKTLYKISALLKNIFNLGKISDLKHLLPEFEQLEVFAKAPEFQELFNRLNSNSFSAPAGKFFNYGKTIQTYLLLEEKKESFVQIMEIVGQLDFYMAQAKLLKNSQGQPNGFCFPEIIDSSKPVFESQGMWNSAIDANKVVPNDFMIGFGIDRGCGALVSGPNYGGKSVFLRIAITNAMLAQSLGIVPAKSMKLTPFHYFDTYASIADSTVEEESLFSAECKRIEELLNIASEAEKNNEKVFFIGDELLTGTKEQYAQAIVRVIFRKLAQKTNGVFVFATHFDPVIKNLQLETGKAFQQLKVDSIVDSQGFYTAPLFKVVSGTSNVNSALFIAAKKFKENQDIVDSAKEIILTEA